MPEYFLMSDLKNLFDFSVVNANKIQTIKYLRQITGEGLKETKDFFEQVLIPAIEHQSLFPAEFGHTSHVGGPMTPLNKGVRNLPPPMYLVGHSYKQLDKNTVLILGVTNFNTEEETVYSLDSHGNVIHRYNRRDFGRVTGTSQSTPDPRNLEVLS